MHPLILGKGRRSFAEGSEEKAFALTHKQTFSSGIVILEYEPASRRPTAATSLAAAG